MNKEIRDYQESVFFGLNFRQCIFSALAIASAVGIYFWFHDVFGEEFTGWFCILGAAPFAACGFFKYHGMTAEQFLWAFIKSEILCPKKLTFQSGNLYYSCLEPYILEGERTGKDGTSLKQKNQKIKKKRGNASD